MAIYVHPNGVETEIKNIYVGEYLEPIFNYSYTFKGKTSAEIGNEWDVLEGAIYADSNGVTGTNGVECRIKKDIPSLATAKRIVVTGTVVGKNGTGTAGSIGIGKGSSWGTGLASYMVYGSNYGGMNVCYYDGTDNKGNTVGNANNQAYAITLTIDLESKTITGSISGLSDSVYTLTDSQITNLRTFDYLVCYTSRSSASISDISITIY